MNTAICKAAAILIAANCIGTAAAQQGFSYNPYGGPQHGVGYQATGSYPSSAFSPSGGYHANSRGGFYYGGVGSSPIGGTYQNLGTGSRYGTHR